MQMADVPAAAAEAQPLPAALQVGPNPWLQMAGLFNERSVETNLR